MSDYVKREEIIDAVIRWIPLSAEERKVDRIIGIMRSLPSADVIDVTQCKKCFYAHHHSKANSISERKRERCKFCKDGTFIGASLMMGNDGDWHKIRFCPNCGAVMRGDSSD